MDPKIYEAAAKGNLEALQQYDHISHPLDGFLTVNQNTILHICISSILVKEKSPAIGGTDQASAAKFVKDVLDKCPSLLLKANAEDDTPLHVAARYGHASIVKVLIEHQKSQHQDLESGVLVEATTEMIGKLNKERDTALHKAVRHNHIEVVKQLLMDVDPEFSFGANVAGETPLCLAAERHFPDLVSEILNKFNSPAYDGPFGRTALHAAAFYNDKDTDAISVNKQTKMVGLRFTWLHTWLALSQQNYCWNLIEVAYMKDTEGRTALHIAAHRNYFVTKEIISMCPDCCEVVDNKGRNALHLTVSNAWRSLAALMIQDNSSLRNLLNQKDNDGNTPFHYYCNSDGRYDEHVLNSPRVDKMVFNKENHNAFQILRSKSFPADDQFKRKVHYLLKDGENSRFFYVHYLLKDGENSRFFYHGRVLEDEYNEIEKKVVVELKQEREKKMEKEIEQQDKAAQVHLVVAALITTVTFATGITMPGGFVGGDDHPHPGSAVLRKSAAFKAFIITNALSLILSSCAIFIHLFIPLLSPKYFFGNRSRRLKIALLFLLFSMAPMVLAFATSTYAVLAHSNIAIPTCIICLSFFPIIGFITRQQAL